jgi:hypothetical protein
MSFPSSLCPVSNLADDLDQLVGQARLKQLAFAREDGRLTYTGTRDRDGLSPVFYAS